MLQNQYGVSDPTVLAVRAVYSAGVRDLMSRPLAIRRISLNLQG